MQSDIIEIDNHGEGFADALEQAKKVAEYRELTHQHTVWLQLLTEELLSLAHSITGELQASFWIECEGTRFDLHMTTRTVMDKEKRAQLIASSTYRRNEAAQSFLGKLRDIIEEAMTIEPNRSAEEIPYELLSDISSARIESTEWDGYERSILKKVADNVKIAIRGGLVEITVCKELA